MLNNLCSERNYNGILQYCKLNELDNIGDCIASHLLYTRHLLGDKTNDDLQRFFKHFRLPKPNRAQQIRIMPLCNWTNTYALSLSLSRLIPPSSRIRFVVSDPDYWLVLNAPPADVTFESERTIVYQMEPHMNTDPRWGEWSSPDPAQFLEVNTHAKTLNAIEWHVSLTAGELLTKEITKTPDLPLSTIQSSRYSDPGQILRIDFLKYLESNGMTVDVYGSNDHGWKNYKGSLPYQKKDAGLLPYKYTFAAENNAIENYVTEKLVDAIVSECLCFYWGCPNVDDWIDSDAYIVLNLNDFEGSMKIIQDAIASDEWAHRIGSIRKAKHHLITELGMVPRMERLLGAE